VRDCLNSWQHRQPKRGVHSRRLPPLGLVWDWASLPQKDPSTGERTPEEATTFQAGLEVMASLYATPRSITLQHKRLPADARDHLGSEMVPYGGLNAPPLAADSTAPARRSGWCTFEESVSSLATSAGGSMYEIGVGWVDLTSGKRPSASEMKSLFDDESTYFFGKADRTSVLRLYIELHQKLAEYDMYMHGGFRHVADRILTCRGPRYTFLRFGLAVAWPALTLSAGIVTAVLQELTGVFMVPVTAIALVPLAAIFLLAPLLNTLLWAWLRGAPRPHSIHVSICRPPVRVAGTHAAGPRQVSPL